MQFTHIKKHNDLLLSLCVSHLTILMDPTSILEIHPNQIQIHPKSKSPRRFRPLVPKPLSNNQDSLLSPQATGIHNQENDQTANDQRSGDDGHDKDTQTTRREFPPNDPMLRFKIPMEADEEHDDRDTQKGHPDGLPQLTQPDRSVVAVVLPAGESRIQSEELDDGDSNACECETRPEPGEEGPFCWGGVLCLVA